MSKGKPESAKKRMNARRERLAQQGLKEASSVIVPIHREPELRALAKGWTEEHLRTVAGTDQAHEEAVPCLPTGRPPPDS